MSLTPPEITAVGSASGSPAMFPAVVRSGDALVLAYSTVPDGWPGGEVQVSRSFDDAVSWEAPLTVARAAEGEQAVLGAIGMTRLHDGTLVLPVNAVRWGDGGTSDRVIGLRLLRSVDHGATWTHDARVDVDFDWPAVYGQLVELDAELLWPVWGRRRDGERWRSAVLSSSDGGLAWRFKATIGYDPEARMRTPYVDLGNNAQGTDPAEVDDPAFRPHDPTDGFSETSVCALSDGWLLAVCRQQGVGGDDSLQLFTSRSDDGGATWQHPAPIGFTGMSPALCRLDDGTLLLATRRASATDGRGPATELRRGAADGTTWGPAEELQHPPGAELSEEYQTGYPAFCADSAGHVLVLFYSFRPEAGRFIAWNRLDAVDGSWAASQAPR